ncbi:hypothetical protein DIPPA_65241 [Diplonema papillatum]|nr:hypothetical protein DIPPA_65241 [Diplonema papillatum]
MPIADREVATVSVGRMVPKTRLCERQTYKLTSRVQGDRCDVKRSDGQLEWFGQLMKEEFPDVLHPEFPRANTAMRTGEFPKCSEKLRSIILCRYIATSQQYYLEHERISRSSLELFAMMSASEDELQQTISTAKEHSLAGLIIAKSAQEYDDPAARILRRRKRRTAKTQQSALSKIGSKLFGEPAATRVGDAQVAVADHQAAGLLYRIRDARNKYCREAETIRKLHCETLEDTSERLADVAASFIAVHEALQQIAVAFAALGRNVPVSAMEWWLGKIAAFPPPPDMIDEVLKEAGTGSEESALFLKSNVASSVTNIPRDSAFALRMRNKAAVQRRMQVASAVPQTARGAPLTARSSLATPRSAFGSTTPRPSTTATCRTPRAFSLPKELLAEQPQSQQEQISNDEHPKLPPAHFPGVRNAVQTSVTRSGNQSSSVAPLGVGGAHVQMYSGVLYTKNYALDETWSHDLPDTVVANVDTVTAVKAVCDVFEWLNSPSTLTTSPYLSELATGLFFSSHLHLSSKIAFQNAKARADKIVKDVCEEVEAEVSFAMHTAPRNAYSKLESPEAIEQEVADAKDAAFLEIDKCVAEINKARVNARETLSQVCGLFVKAQVESAQRDVDAFSSMLALLDADLTDPLAIPSASLPLYSDWVGPGVDTVVDSSHTVQGAIIIPKLSNLGTNSKVTPNYDRNEIDRPTSPSTSASSDSDVESGPNRPLFQLPHPTPANAQSDGAGYENGGRVLPNQAKSKEQNGQKQVQAGSQSVLDPIAFEPAPAGPANASTIPSTKTPAALSPSSGRPSLHSETKPLSQKANGEKATLPRPLHLASEGERKVDASPPSQKELREANSSVLLQQKPAKTPSVQAVISSKQIVSPAKPTPLIQQAPAKPTVAKVASRPASSPTLSDIPKVPAKKFSVADAFDDL